MDVIEKSVGKEGSNSKGDVRVVQLLLNDWLGGEHKTLLKVDGIAGPKTEAAILAFQKAKTKVVDGRIDPQGPTIKALAALHLKALLSGIEPWVYTDLQIAGTPIFHESAVNESLDSYWKALRRG
ncbi:peptidoglycan-binding domain-containing protein [Arenibaculum pallidiluteum]|uniref:peptidoglycan-binding domain-containing protein n=1 Tax=Arenibaculum pallidiluteum TaxID=2812559 RepID=UPI001A96F9A9|nr:peptidoglycan-binding protein [Arenibaculum pallidiluteum]